MDSAKLHAIVAGQLLPTAPAIAAILLCPLSECVGSAHLSSSIAELVGSTLHTTSIGSKNLLFDRKPAA
jgi:hypothetical protein